MGNELTDPPLNYDFGTKFNYAQWTENTELTMLNVPWNNDYRDVWRASSRGRLDQWIDSQPNKKITKMSYLKFNRNAKVNLTLNQAMKYNYVRASNPAMPVAGDIQRNYYYFILDLIPRSPNSTELVLQLDMWQTFGYDCIFGIAFVERGHVGVANTRAFDHYGRDYLTVAEGLDIGGEYRIVHSEHEKIIDTAGDADVEPGYDVLICSTLDLTQDPGDLSSPGIKSAKGGIWQSLPTGASFYIFRTGYDLRTFFDKYSDKPWITQSIINITLLPNMNRYSDSYDYGDNLSTDPSFAFYEGSKRGGSLPAQNAHQHSVMNAWRDNDFIANILGPRYKALRKFLTYPYMVIEMTTWTGSALVLKPESWQDANATIKELAAFMPPGQRIVAYPAGYNADGETSAATQTDNDISKDGDFINTAVTLDNFPTLPVVNNMAIAYLAQNKNGIAWQNASADWSQTKALNAANTGYNQASAGMNLQTGLTGIGTGATSAQAALQAQTIANQALIGGVQDVAGGAVGGSMMGPPGMVAGTATGLVGAAAGQFGAANQQNQVQQAAGISNSAANASNDARVGNAGYMRDTNLALAQFAAKGDNQNTIAGIKAKIQDARLTQPSMSGQYGGDSFNIVNGLFGYSLRWKMPSLDSLRQVGDHWLKYGYAVNRYLPIPSNFMCMSKFTYWKLLDTSIPTATIPESFKQIIRGIFEKGVTVWAEPEYIGRTDIADNEPLPGVAY